MTSNITTSNTRNTRNTRDTELAELFADQEYVLEGLVAAIGFDSRSAYVDGHQEWMAQEDLRLYRQKLEALMGVAKFLKGYYVYMAKD